MVDFMCGIFPVIWGTTGKRLHKNYAPSELCKPRTNTPDEDHPKYSYVVRILAITRSNRFYSHTLGGSQARRERGRRPADCPHRLILLSLRSLIWTPGTRVVFRILVQENYWQH
jgi:hypothetical protein